MLRFGFHLRSVAPPLAFLPLLGAMVGSAGAAEGPWAAPALPGGRESITVALPALIAPPAGAALREGVTVAREAPTVDFLFLPGQDHRGNPWSNWGDGCAAGDMYYTAIGADVAKAAPWVNEA